jgi:hypothetical protein
MKRSQALLGSTLLLAMVPCAYADGSGDCFPMYPEPVAVAPGKTADLCAYGVVREVARIDRDLAPVKKVVGAVTNPTGFALEQLDKHVVHIPRWVGYALDPRGAIRAKVMDRVRHEAKKAVGLENDCIAEDA